MYTYEIVLVDLYAYSVLIIRYWLFIIFHIYLVVLHEGNNDKINFRKS